MNRMSLFSAGYSFTESPLSDTDTDYSESEALSSLPMSGPPKGSAMSPPSQSDSEHHQVLRIETKTAPKPSQVEVVLSDGESILYSI